MTKKPYRDFDYPRITTAERSGVWSDSTDNFVVEEIGLYPFCGEGEHAALIVKKSGLATRELAVAAAKLLGVGPAAVGYAGMKDKNAVTTQAFTVTGVETDKARLAFEKAGGEVCNATRHKNKLRLGHLAGNRFSVFLAGGDAQMLETGLAQLTKSGIPNYYGPQRFGSKGDNAQQGLRVIEGKYKTGRWKRDLLVSALQSFIFNEVLALRIEQGAFATVLAGDVMQKLSSGGIFVCEDTAEDGVRLAGFEISPTGPMFGKNKVEPTGEVAALEADVLCALRIERTAFSGQTGSRRAMRIPLSAQAVEAAQGGAWVSFSLPPGVYATSVIRELAQPGGSKV